MEEPTNETHVTPANEKSCQTDDLTDEAVVPGPDHASRTLVNSTEVGDPPLLQRPLQTSKSGIQQIIECFHTGTEQLKHILLKEVDTIFECKLCRSLFRGLPNLIKHKEVYCFSRPPKPDDPSGDDKKSIEELLEAIYPRSDNAYVLRLEPIAGNQNAVYQYLSTEENLPPSSQSPYHTSTSSCSLELHSDSQEPNAEEKNTDEEEENCIEEEEKASTNKEDAEKDQDTQLSSEDRTEEAAPCKCLLCDRTYKVRGHLQRHLRTVHNIITSVSAEPTSDSKKTANGKLPESPDASTCSSSDSGCQKSPREENKVPWKPVFPAGFDFKARFCNLCRRTFSTEQNLAKHMEMHTDNGTEFFVWFYCCPLCRYKTRRKRDVVRHLSVFHKKSSAYLSRISDSLESSAIKKPAEVVLSREEAKLQQRQEEKPHNSYSSPYRTRRNLEPSNAPRETSVGQKRRAEEATDSVKARSNGAESKVIKSPHICGVCGLSFKKRRFLGAHMTSHQKTAGRRATGVRTRSKVVLW